MDYELLAASFGHQLAGQDLDTETIMEDSGGVRVVVSRGSDGTTIALFEAAEPEYVGLTLENGAHFWENEWASEEQLELANTFGAAVVKYLTNGGEFRKRLFGRDYVIHIEGGTLASRGTKRTPL